MTFLWQGNSIMVSYLWLDTKNALCSKDRVLEFEPREASEVPSWSFDDLAEGVRVDLQPVIIIRDPFRPGAANKIVFCETHVNDKSENAKTSRVKCKLAMEKLKEHQVWCGIQQPFNIINSGCTPRSVAWNGETLKRGAFPALHWGSGREVVEKFNAACLYAGVAISASHASRVASNFVVELKPIPGVLVADHLWLARYILLRVAEEMKICAVFVNSDQLTLSFSTAETRASGGTVTIAALVEKYKNVSENGETLRVPTTVLERHHGYMCLQRAADSDPYEVMKTVAELLSADEVQHSHKVHSTDDITNKGSRFIYGSDRQTFENLRPKNAVQPVELRNFPQLIASESKTPPRMPAPPRNAEVGRVQLFHPFGRPQDNWQRGGFGNVANGRQTINNTFAAGDSTNVFASGGSIFSAIRQQSNIEVVEKPAPKPALPSEPPGMQKIQSVVEKKEPVQESSPLPSKTPSLQSVSTAVSTLHVDSITDVEQPVDVKFQGAIVELAAVTSLEKKQDETAKKEEEPVVKKEELPVTPMNSQAPLAEVDIKPEKIEKISKMRELPATKNKELEPVHDISIIPINAAEVSAEDLNKELEEPSKVAENAITPSNENKKTEKQPEEGSAPEKNIDPKSASGWGNWEPAKETSKTEWKSAFGAGFGSFTTTSTANTNGPAFGGDNWRGGGRGTGSFERGGRGERPPRGYYRGRGEFSRGFGGGRGGNSSGDFW